MSLKIATFLLSAVVLTLALPVDDTTTFLQTGTGGGLNISQLAINGGPGKESKITLGDADESFTVGMQVDGSFVIRHRNEPTFAIDPAGPVTLTGPLRSKGAVRIDGTLNFMGVEQWFLAAVDNFNEGVVGWSNSTTTTCGDPNKMILGGCGTFAGGEVSKYFHDLPAHDSIRVKANYHMIDSWGGESAYLKLQGHYAWTDSLDQQNTKEGISLCCGPAPESRFSVPIDVSMPHSDSTLHVSFGSTLTLSPSEQSWGISDVQVYVRKSS